MATKEQQDRNAVVRKQLLKKREQAIQKRVALDTGELVDDALARAVASFGKWARANSRNIQTAFVGALACVAVYAGYDRWQTKRAEAATSALFKAQADEHGRIGALESKPEAAEVDESVPVFKSVEERRQAALNDYRAVASKFPGSGAALLARLGEAGALFDQHNYDAALGAYREVKFSRLGAADVSVRARCAEGIGLSLEAKKDIEGALQAFRELENTDVRSYKELGMFHQARILAARGDTSRGDIQEAIQKLTAAREKVHAATTTGPYGDYPMFPYLQSQIDDLLASLDPTSAAAGARRETTAESMQRAQEKLRRQIKESVKNLGGQAPAQPAQAPTGTTP